MNTRENQHNDGYDAEAVVIAALREAMPQAQASADFNDALRQRWERELGVRGSGERPLQRWLPLLRLSGVAAVLTLAAVAWVLMDAAGANVAWADVREAARRLPHFQITVAVDQPRSTYGPKSYRLDIYHQAPDLWRVQGVGHVFFAHGTQVRQFDVDPSDDEESRGEPELLPKEFLDQFDQRGLLDAILTMVFDGEPPEGEPVLSDVAQEPGVAVFDYAHDATKAWARIWVLRASKLPIMMKIYNTGSDETMQLTFDYATTQPERFFDAAYFEKEHDRRNDEPWEAYRIGMEAVDARKPTASDQIYDVRGGYRTGELLEVGRLVDGALMIAVTDPDNHAAPGHGGFEEGYPKVLRDNWGNTYFRVNGYTAYTEPRRCYWVYTPVKPFKQGEGPQRIELVYAIRFHTGDPEDPEDIELDRRTVEVPLKDAPLTKELAGCLTPGQREQAMRRYVKEYEPLTAQVDYVGGILARSPDDLDANLWLHRLLTDHGRKAQADAVMESKLLEPLLDDPRPGGDVLGRHLLDLCNRGEVERVRGYIERLRQSRERLLREAKQQPWEKEEVERVFEQSHYVIAAAMQAPDLIEAFERAPKPTVKEIVRGRDGALFVEFTTPEGWQPSPFHGIEDALGGWWCAWFKNRDRSIEAVFLPNPNTAGRGRFLLRAVLNPPHLRDHGAADAALIGTVMLEAVAPEATVDSISDYRAQRVPDEPRIDFTGDDVTAYDRLQSEAAAHKSAGRLEEALSVYRQALELPESEWPTYLRPPNPPETITFLRGQLQREVVSLLIQLGRYEEARPIIASIDPGGGPEYRFENYHRNAMRDLAMQLHTAQARWLVRQGRLDEAEALLDELDSRLPDETTLKHSIQEKTTTGTIGYSPRYGARGQRQLIDTVRWDLRDARAGTPRP